MFVSFRSVRGGNGNDGYREVHTVFAVQSFRGRRAGQDVTAPVAVGRHLFAQGLLTRHSPDRSEAGERWARAVTPGPLRKRDPRATTTAIESVGSAALARLNQIPWDLPVTD